MKFSQKRKLEIGKMNGFRAPRKSLPPPPQKELSALQNIIFPYCYLFFGNHLAFLDPDSLTRTVESKSTNKKNCILGTFIISFSKIGIAPIAI
jgi:hypothetical protein